MSQPAKQSYYLTPKFFLTQNACLLILILITLWMSGWIAAYSLALGVVVAWVPHWVLTRMVFKHQGARRARQMLRSLYLGEAIKWFLTATLLAMVFVWVEPLNVFYFIGSFVIMQFINGMAPMLAASFSAKH